ncbi:Nucleoporin 93kD-1 [Carabus blaptoides fortunei]
MLVLFKCLLRTKMSASDFNDLLFQAEKLSSTIESTSDLPKVERSLRQVLEASNELYTRVRQTGAHDIQANLLLGSKGIDLPQIAQKLEAISSKRTFEPLDPIADNDVQSFLKNEVENCILACIDDVHKKTLSGIEDQIWEHINSEWKQEKRKILNAMIGPSQNFLDIRKHDVFQTTQDRSVPSTLSYQEQIYVRHIIDYNKMIVTGSTKPVLVTLLSKAAEQFKDTKVNDMWEMLKYMLELPPYPKNEDPIISRNSKSVKGILVEQAKKYLEERYKTYMSSVINENLHQAKRGGVPGTYPLVRSFVGIRLQGGYLGLQDGAIDDRPLWPMYRRQVRNATDPFKRAVYCILGCCDVNDEHSEVAKTADDYLWLKLSLVRDDEETEEHINYSDLQTTILEEYGEAHYEAHIQPHLYFQMLILTGQFEAAIEFLARTERYRPHAVHFAITVNEIFMLGGPRCVDAPLISVDPEDSPPSRRLNIARLIMLYVKKFEITNPLEAIHYYYMLRNLHTLDRQNLFMVCVGDLAQETRDYELIFGKIMPNGLRSQGLIDQFVSSSLSTESLAEMVANELVKKGLYEDAIKLYDLADNQEEVLSILCTLLSQVVHLRTKSGSLRERLQVTCHELNQRYTNSGFKCTAPVASSFVILRDLMIFFDQYHARQFVLAMETLMNLRLIPLAINEVDERVANFKRLAPEVCKIVPDILLATMNMLYEQYKHLKSNTSMINKFEDSAFLRQLQFVREQAKAVTNFAGTVPYRMPGDTNTRLVQMEILMH